jgi:predicted ribosome quality control (RQC) complex YloA/Tae2 family protein
MDGLAIAASLKEWERHVLGASIRAVYQPERETFVLHLFAGKDVRLLVSPGEAAIHLTELDLPYPTKPSPFVMLLRKHLRGGRIVAVDQQGWERAVTIAVERRSEQGLERSLLVGELVGVRGNLILLRSEHVLGALRPDPRAEPGSPYQPLSGQGKLHPERLAATDLAGVAPSPDGCRALVRLVDGVGKETARAVLARAEALEAGAFEERVLGAFRFVLGHVSAPRAEYDPGTRVASFFPLLPPGEPAPSFAAALDRAFTDRHESEHESEETGTLQAGLSRAAAKRERTLAKLAEWLREADSAETLRRHADLILTGRGEIPHGAREAALRDLATGELVTVALDPRKSAIENAQALYEKAKRLRRGRPIVERRKGRIERDLALLRGALACLAEGKELDEEAIALIPRSRRVRREPPPASPRVYRVLGHTVQVGKDASQNDLLLREASPDDLWLHAKGVSGSHVIVRQRGREKIPPEVVEEAARLAARFSKAKGERRVEVTCTPVKYVRKPKGARAGLVIVTREDTLTVHLEEGGDKG